jgi:cell division protein FtsA
MKGLVLKTGIDIGSKSIKVVVSSDNPETGKNQVLAATKEVSQGIIHGQIVSYKEASMAINRAIKRTEKALGLSIKKIAIGINTTCTKNIIIKTKTTVAKASNEISELDLEKTKSDALKSLQMDSPFDVLHTTLSSVSVDGKIVKAGVLGMIGNTLEATYILTIIPKKSLSNIISIFDDLKLEIVEIYFNGLINSITLTTKRDRLFGVAILDIGGDNTTFTIYENGLPVSTSIYSIGGNTFNKDISIGIGLKIEEAENIKKNLKSSDAKKIFSIIDARLDDFAELIKKDLQKMRNSVQLANGIILTGGSANLYEIKERLKHKLKIPITDGKEIISKNTDNVLKDAVWTNAYSLTFLDFSEISSGKTIFIKISSFLRDFMRKIAP